MKYDKKVLAVVFTCMCCVSSCNVGSGVNGGAEGRTDFLGFSVEYDSSCR